MISYRTPFLRLSFVTACVALLSVSITTHASPLFEQTGGLFGTSGLNARFIGSDPSAAFFNPASLTEAQNGLSLGYGVFREDIGITLGPRDQPYGGQDPSVTPFDIPGLPSLEYKSGYPFSGVFSTDAIYRGESCTNNCLRARPRQGAGTGHQTFQYVTIGLTQRIFDQYLVGSFYAVLPLGKFTTTDAFFVDEKEQFFSNSLHPEFYGDRLTAPSIAVGVASQPIPELSLGLGMTIALLNTANAGVFTRDAADLQGAALLKARVGVIAKISPHFSLNYRPIPDLQLTAAFHSPSRFEIGLNFSNTLATGNEQVANRTMVHDYTPWFIALGANYVVHISRFDLAVVGGVKIGLWSHYINRHNKTPGKEYARNANMLPPHDYSWRNTVVPTIGARFGEPEHWNAGIDFEYVPTPVPEQTGRTNYVDNNKVVAMLSGTYRFKAGPIDMGVGANIQGHFLFKRRNTKIMPNTDYTSVNMDPESSGYGTGFAPDLVIDELPDNVRERGKDAHWEGAEGLQTNNPGFPWYESAGSLFGASVHVSFYY